MRQAALLAAALLAASAACAEPGDFAPPERAELRLEDLRALGRRIAASLRDAPAMPQRDMPPRRWDLGEAEPLPPLAIRHELSRETLLELRLGRVVAPNGR